MQLLTQLPWVIKDMPSQGNLALGTFHLSRSAELIFLSSLSPFVVFENKQTVLCYLVFFCSCVCSNSQKNNYF